MKTLKLQMDALVVESFPTGAAEAPDGTARALQATRPQVCDPFTLPPRCTPAW